MKLERPTLLPEHLDPLPEHLDPVSEHLDPLAEHLDPASEPKKLLYGATKLLQLQSRSPKKIN